MLYLKIMSDQNLPDSDSCKDFTLYQISDKDRLSFERRSSTCEEEAGINVVYAVIDSENGERVEHWLTGNAYVLNAQGKTIASRGTF